jgi:hypothetical protein
VAWDSVAKFRLQPREIRHVDFLAVPQHSSRKQPLQLMSQRALGSQNYRAVRTLPQASPTALPNSRRSNPRRVPPMVALADIQKQEPKIP